MKDLIAILKRICDDERTTEKLLFVPSHAIGRQVLESLVRTGTSWINLRISTPLSYAADLLRQDLTARGIRLIDAHERYAVVERLYREEDVPDRGLYFEEAADIPGILMALSNVIHEIRMAGVTADGIDAASFLVPDKGAELKWLVEAYERFLEDHAFIDHAGLLRMAIKKAGDLDGVSGERRVLILSGSPFAFLEKELVYRVGGEELVVVEPTSPDSTRPPQRFSLRRGEGPGSDDPVASDLDLLRWLLGPEEAPAPFQDGTVALYHALGESNEAREVFRRILTGTVPFDDVEILVTGVEPYVPMIYNISESLGIPCTFAPGVSATMTRPGRALLLFLRWVSEDFSSRVLRELLSGGYLEFGGNQSEEQMPSPVRAASLLREAAIGWGRDRYAPRLEILHRSFLEKSRRKSEGGEKELADRYARTASYVLWVRDLVNHLMRAVPVPDADGNVNTGEFFDGCAGFVSGFCRTAGDFDAAAKSSIEGLVASLRRLAAGVQPLGHLVDRLAGVIRDTWVGQSNPKPGRIHVSHYHSGGYSGRGHTFVLGLDQGRFPGTVVQNPVLLDEEREKISPELVTSGELLHEKAYAMAGALSRLSGAVTLSYPCRELRENRELLPSSLFLSVFRLTSGDSTADYSALEKALGEPVGFIPDPCVTPLNDWEWWLARRQDRFGRDSVYACYPRLLDGENAEAERARSELTEYDGYVSSAAGALDPCTSERALSATRLERLASCPFAYFIRYVLRIEPLEELEKDASRWLDALQRGGLLHEVFRRFMQKLKEMNGRPTCATHWPLLEAVGLEVVAEYRAEVPPPSDLAFTRELDDLKQALMIFLRDEEEHCRDTEPCFFELSFGGDEEGPEADAFSAPVEIAMPDGTRFRMRGSIDRVDRSGPHEYEVWDYKTGSTFGYRDEDYFKRGTQLQHALYALTAEQLLRRDFDKNARVITSGYSFPGVKGEGLRIERSQTRRDEVYAVLHDLFELLRKGLFPSSHDSDPCTFCDYASVCGDPPAAVARSKARLDEDEKLAPFTRLKDHA